ncbi:hypothetical protein [uncultured Robinsoniella sp.]
MGENVLNPEGAAEEDRLLQPAVSSDSGQADIKEQTVAEKQFENTL